MDLFANELSFHGQFPEISTFRDAFARLVAMREVARRFGTEVHCGRALLSRNAMPGMPMQQALQRFPESMRRDALRWMTRGGPFWDDIRQHSAGDWLECRGEIVTDSTVGEAAYRSMHGIASGLISITPSDWDLSPVAVTWRWDDGALEDGSIELENWRCVAALEAVLRDSPPPVQSWGDLQRMSTAGSRSLTFAGDCFGPLDGVPFAKSAADRIVALLDILDRFVGAFDDAGVRTPEGQQIYQDYFTGRDNALFSDSSDDEKRKFGKEMVFRHPNDPRKYLSCTWHGKVNNPKLRVHFSWPVRFNEPVFVVYIGPKITRR